MPVITKADFFILMEGAVGFFLGDFDTKDCYLHPSSVDVHS